jgi:hypothetical protein
VIKFFKKSLCLTTLDTLNFLTAHNYSIYQDLPNEFLLTFSLVKHPHINFNVEYNFLAGLLTHLVNKAYIVEPLNMTSTLYSNGILHIQYKHIVTC